MAKVVGIKLGNHASYEDTTNKVYYYFALDDYNIGDTVAVILPGGKMVCVPVVEKADIADGKVGDIKVKKYVVGKVDDANYREYKKAEKVIEEKKVTLRRKGHAIKNRVEYLVGQKTWIDWAREDIGILTLLGDYYLAKKDYEAVAGKDAADIEDARISDERINTGDDGLPY